MTCGADRRFRRFQFTCSHWQKPMRARAGAHRAVEARLDDGLRQADLGGHAEAFVNRRPFAQERAVAVARSAAGTARASGCARPGRRAARGAGRLRRGGRSRSAGSCDPRERVGERRVLPDGIAGPVAFGWKRDEKAARPFAPEGNRAVGDDEQVLPERVRRAIRRHRVLIGLEPVARRRVERARFLRGRHARAKLRRERECG